MCNIGKERQGSRICICYSNGIRKSFFHPCCKELQSSANSSISDCRQLEFRQDCMDCLSKIIQKIQTKSPLKYSILRQMASLDPRNMFTDPDMSKERMKRLVQKFLQDGQLSGGVSAGTKVNQGKAVLKSVVSVTLFFRFDQTPLQR